MQELTIKQKQQIELLENAGFNYQGLNHINNSIAFTKQRTDYCFYYANIFNKYIIIKLKGETETQNGLRKFVAVKKLNIDLLNEPMLNKVIGVLNRVQESV